MSAGMASTTLSQIYYVFVSDLLATGHDNLARHQSHTSFGGQMLIAFYFYLAVMIFRICRFAAVEGWQSATKIASRVRPIPVFWRGNLTRFTIAAKIASRASYSVDSDAISEWQCKFDSNKCMLFWVLWHVSVPNVFTSLEYFCQTSKSTKFELVEVLINFLFHFLDDSEDNDEDDDDSDPNEMKEVHNPSFGEYDQIWQLATNQIIVCIPSRRAYASENG
ncbi:hypothetical protein Tco_0017052 [Tanacetum coccineum]